MEGDWGEIVGGIPGGSGVGEFGGGVDRGEELGTWTMCPPRDQVRLYIMLMLYSM